MRKMTLEKMVVKFANIYTTFSIFGIRRMMARDFHYASMWVFDEIKTRRAYLKYLKVKLKTIKKSVEKGGSITADIVYDTHTNVPYILLVQGPNRALLVFKEENGKLKRADLCGLNYYSFSSEKKGAITS